MIKQDKFFKGLFLISLMWIFSSTQKAKAAEKVAFENGIFRRIVTIENIEAFIRSGEAEGFINDLATFTKEDKKQMSEVLTQEFELPLMLTSRLMNSRIGEVIIKRVAKIIYPLKVQKESVSVPAIRAAIIKGIHKGKGKINLLSFLKSYPNKTISINVPAMFKVIKKVESISELVKFFSKSPLEELKERKL